MPVVYRILRFFGGEWTPHMSRDYQTRALADQEFDRLLDAIDHVGGPERVRLVKATITYRDVRVRTMAKSRSIRRKQVVEARAVERIRKRKSDIHRRLDEAARARSHPRSWLLGGEVKRLINDVDGRMMGGGADFVLDRTNWRHAIVDEVLTRKEMLFYLAGYEEGKSPFIIDGLGRRVWLRYLTPDGMLYSWRLIRSYTLGYPSEARA